MAILLLEEEGRNLKQVLQILTPIGGVVEIGCHVDCISFRASSEEMAAIIVLKKGNFDYFRFFGEFTCTCELQLLSVLLDHHAMDGPVGLWIGRPNLQCYLAEGGPDIFSIVNMEILPQEAVSPQNSEDYTTMICLRADNFKSVLELVQNTEEIVYCEVNDEITFHCGDQTLGFNPAASEHEEEEDCSIWGESAFFKISLTHVDMLWAAASLSITVSLFHGVGSPTAISFELDNVTGPRPFYSGQVHIYLHS